MSTDHLVAGVSASHMHRYTSYLTDLRQNEAYLGEGGRFVQYYHGNCLGSKYEVTKLTQSQSE
jgi:hypothetical protein